LHLMIVFCCSWLLVADPCSYHNPHSSSNIFTILLLIIVLLSNHVHSPANTASLVQAP
jgi:hypothetical protein